MIFVWALGHSVIRAELRFHNSAHQRGKTGRHKWISTLWVLRTFLLAWFRYRLINWL